MIIIGTCVVLFYQKIADNLAGGLNSYEKVKLFGLIFAGIGLLVMTNLHTLILYALMQLILPQSMKKSTSALLPLLYFAWLFTALF